MTDEQILSAAEACGLLNDCLDVETMSVCILAFTKFMVGVELYKEREACAELCDYVYENIVTDEHIKDMAFKIRARGVA